MTTLKRYTGTAWETVAWPTDVGMSPQTLGYAEVTTSQTGITNTVTDLTGLSVTVTVPAGRRIRITGGGLIQSVTTAGRLVGRIREGAATLGRWATTPMLAIGDVLLGSESVIITPTAGTHTYKLSLEKEVGGGTAALLAAASDFPGFILVEDVTGSTLPYQPASVPVGLLAQASLSADTATTTAVEADSGLAVNIVVPAGRTLRVSAEAMMVGTVNGDGMRLTIKEGPFGLRIADVDVQGSKQEHVTASIVLSPSAGSHTYNLHYGRWTGTGTVKLIGGNTYPVHLSVEDITPTPAPSGGAPSSTLGYAQATANQMGITNQTTLTGLVVTVTVPAGRRIRISGEAYFQNTVVNPFAGARMFINEGGTQLQQNDQRLTVAATPEKFALSAVISPTAGSHTYSLAADNGGGGTVTMVSGPAYPAFILVEDITGVGVPGHTHTELDDTGWLPVTLINGWAVYGDGNYGTANVVRRKSGVVYMRGLLTSTAATSGTAFVLPVGFRPSGVIRLFGAHAASGFFRYDVDTVGNVVGPTGQSWVSFAGITFPVDQ